MRPLRRPGLTVPHGTLPDLAPSISELADLSGYLRALRLWRMLNSSRDTITTCRQGRALHRLAKAADLGGVPGALVDCGVYNGGSTLLLSLGAPNRRVWAFDSFSGMPSPGPEDGVGDEWTGASHGSEQRLAELFERHGARERLQIVAGWFEDTLPREAGRVGPIAVLHLDCDWYESIKPALAALYPSVSPGGFVVIDDYGHFEGARKATDEFRAAHGITAPLEHIDYRVVYWRKA